MSLPVPADMTYTWAETGTIQVPPNNGFIEAGWVPGNPSYQIANWLENRQDYNLNAIQQCGILPWITTFTYPQFGIVLGSDGNIYQSLQNSNLNNNPTSSPSFWVMIRSAPKGFFAFQTGVFGISTSVLTKVPFNSVVFNYNSEYNNTTYRFSPQTPGNYLITSMVEIGLISQSGLIVTNSVISIYLNGAQYIKNVYGYDTGNGYTHLHPSVSAIVPMNGTTDYVEIFALVSTGSGFAFQNVITTPFFQATKV